MSELPDPISGSGVMLDFRRDWCPRHLEAFKPAWPKGAGPAMLMLFQAFASDERVQRAAGHDPETGRLADGKMLGRLVMEFGPLCCFLGDEISAEIAEQAISGEGPRIEAIRKPGASRPPD